MFSRILPVSSLCLLLTGCMPPSTPDRDDFQVSAETLIADDNTEITVIKITTRRNAEMQLAYRGKLHGSDFQSVLLETNGATAIGRIVLSAVKVSSNSDTNWKMIQIMSHAADLHGGGGATCTGTYSVKPDVRLTDFYKITATNETGRFFVPLTIAWFDDGPVSLVLTNAP